jgi:hypothetical protein
VDLCQGGSKRYFSCNIQVGDGFVCVTEGSGVGYFVIRLHTTRIKCIITLLSLHYKTSNIVNTHAGWTPIILKSRFLLVSKQCLPHGRVPLTSVFFVIHVFLAVFGRGKFLGRNFVIKSGFRCRISFVRRSPWFGPTFPSRGTWKSGRHEVSSRKRMCAKALCFRPHAWLNLTTAP